MIGGQEFTTPIDVESLGGATGRIAQAHGRREVQRTLSAKE
jgi:hypothetical protein